jgi:hypothetical protein
MPASSGSLNAAAVEASLKTLFGGGDASLERAGLGEASIPSGENIGERGRSFAIASLNWERTSTVANPATERGTCEEKEEPLLFTLVDICGRVEEWRGEVIVEEEDDPEAANSNSCSCRFVEDDLLSSSTAEATTTLLPSSPTLLALIVVSFGLKCNDDDDEDEEEEAAFFSISISTRKDDDNKSSSATRVSASIARASARSVSCCKATARVDKCSL